MASYSIESILQEKIVYSSYSAEESFTLSDILAERDEVDEELLRQEQVIEQGMFDDYFDEDEEQNEENIHGVEQTTAIKITPVDQQQQHQQNKNIQHETQQANKANNKLALERVSVNKSNRGVVSQKQKSQNFQKSVVNEQVREVDRCKRIQNLMVPPLSDIKNICFIVLNNVTAAFDSKATGVGIPTVITSNGFRFMAIGTSFGNVVLFQIGNKDKRILGSAQNRKFGGITSISISRQGRYLVFGQENGLITVWDLYHFTEIKKELATEAKIIKILFCSENQFILADSEGNVFLFTIQNNFWIKMKRDRLFQKSESIFYDVRAYTLQTGIEVLVLCSLDQILVATYKPKIQAIDRLVRPEELFQQKLPNIQIGKTAILTIQNSDNKLFQYNDVLCVSWSNQILVYKFMEGVRLQKLKLMYRFTQETPIYNMEFISEGVLVTLDSKQTFRSFRIWINGGGGHMLLNEKLIPQEIIYQRYFRDSNNRYIKLFNNTIISCSFNPKQKQLFFISKSSIYRCRIYKWNEYISDLIGIQNRYQQALKICIQIFYNRMNIFLEPVVVNDKSLKVFCQVGKIYIEKRLQMIEKLKLDRARNIDVKDQIKNITGELEQTYDCIIEYMLEIRCSNELFENIYRNIIKQRFIGLEEYRHKFFQCLEPFIMLGRVVSLPSKLVFDELINYYLSRGKKELVDHFIMFLNVKSLSLFYEDAIEVCSQNKMYKALAYVCSTHEDFISPLNNLLAQIKAMQKNHMLTALQTYYSILKDYIVKLLGGCYINGISFDDEKAIMKKSLSNWLMCKETFQFFTKNQVEAYHRDYFCFIEELIYLLSSEPTLEEYIHSELKHITKQDFKGRQIAQLFIKISQTLSLDEGQVKIIVTYSDCSLIDKYLSIFLHFYRTYQSQLQVMPQIQSFYTKNKQLHYLHYILKINTQKLEHISVLSKVNLLQNVNQQLNSQLTKYLLNKMNSENIIWNIQDLLKIHSQNTMVFMLQRFSLDTVNERLINIKDVTYRYLVVRKLLKMLRKQNKQGNRRQKIKKYHVKKVNMLDGVVSNNTALNQSKLIINSESDTQSVFDQQQGNKENVPRRRLGKEIMKFYLECLCKFKNQKRVYYELICNNSDYFDNVDSLITMIENYQYNSCLGLLEQARKNYQRSYELFQQVYRHFFFQENYKKLMAKTHCHGRFMRRIFQKMLSLTQVMNKDNQWMEILKCIIRPLEEKGKNKALVCDDIQDIYAIVGKDHPSLRQLGEIIEQCLINVSNKIPIETISKFIGQHQHVFSLMFVLDSFRTTLLTYSNNAKIYILTNEMVINDQIAKFEEIYQNLIKGFPPSNKCEKCGQGFNAQDVMRMFKCGHSYHITCPENIVAVEGQPYRSSLVVEEEKEDNQNQFDKKAQKQQKSQLRCEKCQEQQNKGMTNIEQEKLPDFNTQESGMLMKGMVGIVSIIPNMISVIPSAINIFSSGMQEEEKLVMLTPDTQTTQGLEDEVMDYLAFEGFLSDVYDQNQQFLRDCSKYFQGDL